MVPHAWKRCPEVYQNPRFLYNAGIVELCRRVGCALILLALALSGSACTTAPEPEPTEVPSIEPKEFHPLVLNLLEQETRRGALPPLPEKGYFLHKLGADVYFFSNQIANTLFVVSPKGVVLVDPILESGPLLRKAMAEVTEQRVSNLILLTSHPAHVGDAGEFDNASIVAHRTTSERLRKAPLNGVLPPRYAFNKNYVLKTPNNTLRLSHTGGEDGVTLLHLPEAGVLMVPDRAIPEWVPFVGKYESIQKRMDDVQQMLLLNFHTYLSGHAHRPGERKELERVLEFYQAGSNALRFAVKRVLGADVIQGDRLTLSSTQLESHRQEILRECFRILEVKMGGKWVGFREFAPGQCEGWLREMNRPSEN